MPLGPPRSDFRIRAAHTLAELLVAVISGSMLLAAIASTMYIAGQVAYSPVPAQHLLKSTQAAFALTDELRHAIYIVDHTPISIEFVTHDRNGDGVEDTIKYAWSGTAGDPLTKVLNRGTPRTVVEAVHGFELDYVIPKTRKDLEVLLRDPEMQLDPAYTSASNYNLQRDNHLAQRVDLSNLPASAESWTLTRTEFEASQTGDINGEFAVQLRLAASDGSPTDEVLAEYVVQESDLASGWNAITWPNPPAGLSPHREYCMVFLWLNGDEAAKIHLANSPAAAFLTKDDGATWSSLGKWAQVISYAEPVVRDQPLSIRHDRLQGVRIQLKSDDSEHTRIDTSVMLENTPLLVEEAWLTGFAGDPTTQDANGDGAGDFVWSGGTTFDMSKIAGGKWLAQGYLEVEHDVPVTAPVLVEFRGETTASGGDGATAQALVRVGSAEHVALSAVLVLESDGTQSARLDAYDGATWRTLIAVKELPARPLHVRMIVAPSRQLVALEIEGVAYPVVSLPVVDSAIVADRFLFTKGSSDTEFDDVAVQVTLPAT